jgi:hypothetical protein
MANRGIAFSAEKTFRMITRCDPLCDLAQFRTLFVPLPLAFIPTPALTRLRRRRNKNCCPGT